MDKTSTRKLLLTTGCIISIIYGIMLMLTAIFLILCASYINFESVTRILTEYDLIDQYTESEIDSITSQAKFIFIFGSIYSFIIGFLQLLFAILLYKSNSAIKENKGLVIALLVTSIFCMNIVTFALMIAVLCLKVEKNFDEIFIELDRQDSGAKDGNGK